MSGSHSPSGLASSRGILRSVRQSLPNMHNQLRFLCDNFDSGRGWSLWPCNGRLFLRQEPVFFRRGLNWICFLTLCPWCLARSSRRWRLWTAAVLRKTEQPYKKLP